MLNITDMVYAILQTVLETPYALTGSHNLAKATVKGKFMTSAKYKQWSTSQKTLMAILDAFQL